jgi:low temperature requirement protein LtrA
VVIIALGESVVTIGLAAGENEVTVGLLTAAGVAVLIAAAMWWLYFDVVSLVAERRLHQVQGRARNALARDSYSYIHGLMIVGIVFVALGLKKSLLYLHEPLETVAAVALFGGLALYLLGHLLFRLRNVGSLNVARAVAMVVLVACIPVAFQVDAVASVVLAAVVMLGLVSFEGKHYAEARRRIRAAQPA